MCRVALNDGKQDSVVGLRSPPASLLPAVDALHDSGCSLRTSIGVGGRQGPLFTGGVAHDAVDGGSGAEALWGVAFTESFSTVPHTLVAVVLVLVAVVVGDAVSIIDTSFREGSASTLPPAATKEAAVDMGYSVRMYTVMDPLTQLS